MRSAHSRIGSRFVQANEIAIARATPVDAKSDKIRGTQRGAKVPHMLQSLIVSSKTAKRTTRPRARQCLAMSLTARSRVMRSRSIERSNRRAIACLMEIELHAAIPPFATLDHSAQKLHRVATWCSRLVGRVLDCFVTEHQPSTTAGSLCSTAN